MTQDFTPGDRVRENWSHIVGTVTDVYDGNCLITWPSGRRTVVANIFLVEDQS